MPDSPPPTDPSPQEALASVRRAQASVVERVNRADTVGYDLRYAVVVGVMVSAPGLPNPYSTLLIILCAAALGRLASGWANATGLWISGITPRRARWIAIGLGVLLMGFMFGGPALTRTYGLRWASPALGLLAAGLAFATSRLWWRIYRAETEG